MAERVMSLEQKQKLIADLIAKQNDKFGKGSIVKATEIEPMKFFSSGVNSLNLALGGKGFPRGRIISLCGPFSSSKTTCALQTIATAQKADPNSMALYVDQEAAFDAKYAANIGCDLDRITVIPAGPAEVNLDILRTAINAGIYDIIVLDSSNALAPEVELEKDVAGNASVGTTAKLLSVFIRQIIGPLNKHNTLMFIIEQERDEIGGYSAPGMGTPVTIGCGRAVGFYCSVRVAFKKAQTINEGEEAVATNIKFTIKKNKVAAPGRKGETVVRFGVGFDAELDKEVFLAKYFGFQDGGNGSEYMERASTVKWIYHSPSKGDIEIKGRSKIMETLKNEGLIDEVLSIARGEYEKEAKVDEKAAALEAANMAEEQNAGADTGLDEDLPDHEPTPEELAQAALDTQED